MFSKISATAYTLALNPHKDNNNMLHYTDIRSYGKKKNICARGASKLIFHQTLNLEFFDYYSHDFKLNRDLSVEIRCMVFEQTSKKTLVGPKNLE